MRTRSSKQLKSRNFEIVVKSVRNIERMLVFKKNIISNSERKIKYCKKICCCKNKNKKRTEIFEINVTQKDPG